MNLAFLREIPVVLLVSSKFFPPEAHHLLETEIKGLLVKEQLSEIVPALKNLFFPRSSPAHLGGMLEAISCMII